MSDEFPEDRGFAAIAIAKKGLRAMSQMSLMSSMSHKVFMTFYVVAFVGEEFLVLGKWQLVEGEVAAMAAAAQWRKWVWSPY